MAQASVQQLPLQRRNVVRVVVWWLVVRGGRRTGGGGVQAVVLLCAACVQVCSRSWQDTLPCSAWRLQYSQQGAIDKEHGAAADVV
jgi:hypothetical protein